MQALSSAVYKTKGQNSGHTLKKLKSTVTFRLPAVTATIQDVFIKRLTDVKIPLTYEPATPKSATIP
jgi:hypothetical protein